MRTELPVFYDDRQNAQLAHDFSPSAAKPAEAIKSWQRMGYPMALQSFPPVERSQLYAAHSPLYVDGVLDLKISNGFRTLSRDVAASLPWTSGSMLAAARHVVKHGGAACSPTSGFHHAHWSRGHGYCTFNGLIVTAVSLLNEGLVKKVGILDIDVHFGDGTQNILDKLELNDDIAHWTFGRDSSVWNPSGTPAWLRTLESTVEDLGNSCDVVLYQAGGDPHVCDPLGGVMTSAQLRERDRIVFQTLARMGKPVAWNLAGGYQRPLEKVLALHDATMDECIQAYLT